MTLSTLMLSLDSEFPCPDVRVSTDIEAGVWSKGVELMLYAKGEYGVAGASVIAVIVGEATDTEAPGMGIELPGIELDVVGSVGESAIDSTVSAFGGSYTPVEIVQLRHCSWIPVSQVGNTTLGW